MRDVLVICPERFQLVTPSYSRWTWRRFDAAAPTRRAPMRFSRLHTVVTCAQCDHAVERRSRPRERSDPFCEGAAHSSGSSSTPVAHVGDTKRTGRRGQARRERRHTVTSPISHDRYVTMLLRLAPCSGFPPVGCDGDDAVAPAHPGDAGDTGGAAKSSSPGWARNTREHRARGPCGWMNADRVFATCAAGLCLTVRAQPDVSLRREPRTTAAEAGC